MTEATQQTPPQRDGHPIRDLVAELLVDGAAGQEPAVLPPEALAKLKGEIDKYVGSQELVDVVETLLLIANLLEVQQKSPSCAGELCDLVERESVINALKDLNRQKDAQRAEQVHKTAEKFSGFTGSTSSRNAPKTGEAAPKDSIKLGNLNFPKKL